MFIVCYSTKNGFFVLFSKTKPRILSYFFISKLVTGQIETQINWNSRYFTYGDRSILGICWRVLMELVLNPTGWTRDLSIILLANFWFLLINLWMDQVDLFCNEYCFRIYIFFLLSSNMMVVTNLALFRK